MKITIFQGELTDISAKKEALASTMVVHLLFETQALLKHRCRSVNTFKKPWNFTAVI